MFFLNKRDTYPLIVPAALILISSLLVWQWPGLVKHLGKTKELQALLTILPFLPYVFFTIGFIIGWRFNNAGMTLTTFVLILSYLTLPNLGSGGPTKAVVGPTASEAMSFLLPLNLAYFATLRRRRIFTPAGLVWVGVILVQIFGVMLLGNPQMISSIQGLYAPISNTLTDFLVELGYILHGRSLLGFNSISIPSLLSFLAALVILVRRFSKNIDSLSAASLCTLVAVFLGISNRPGPSPMLFFSAAGLILIMTSIETSFSMAYIDELSGLPGRRSLNEVLVNLGKTYSIAMIDIDHFKRFNDKYGHETGDQVLKMVASKLKELNGGAKVFRYGGEEFTAIFPGKSSQEAISHLESYRGIIESTPFVVRDKGRRKSSAENRGKTKPGDWKRANVTVSIGVASSNRRLSSPDKVLKAADKILYKAKKAGRNRVQR